MPASINVDRSITDGRDSPATCAANDSRPTLDQVATELRESLRDVLADGRGFGSMRPLSVSGAAVEPLVPDHVTKWLIRDRVDQPRAVVLCSSPVAPGLVSRGMQRAREAKRALGPDLSRVILDPLHEGEVLGLSYAVLPFGRPLSESRWIRAWQRRRLLPTVLDWLRGAARATLREAVGAEVEAEFERPLRHLADLAAFPGLLRSAADDAVSTLQAARWTPRHVLMHNDFWDGNLLIDVQNATGRANRPWRERFLIIDWPGAQVRGYGFYDLLRFAKAMSLSQNRLANEVAAHCAILGCDPVHAKCHLLAALGHLELHRERFPWEHYVRTALACWETLTAVTGVRAR